MEKRARPVFLELWHISLPPGALVSIAHRISGVALFASLPLLLLLFQHSLQGVDEFNRVVALLDSGLMRMLLLPLLWALLHHLLAGVRLLLLDMGIGNTRLAARRSAQGVFSLTLSLLLLVVLFA